MKHTKKILTLLMVVIATVAFAKKVTLEFKVEGQCGECKERIETALDKSGISYASWNVDTKMLTVKFNDKKISENDIHKIISELGYSTDKMAANKTAEQKLPKCCQPGGHADGHHD